MLLFLLLAGFANLECVFPFFYCERLQNWKGQRCMPRDWPLVFYPMKHSHELIALTCPVMKVSSYHLLLAGLCLG